ncbi:MAG TPA: imidazole glycerol phosphate synthase subunit HisH [Oscillospiraceae bacterium]|nr:imidazole glycerol phosphate synthase subunit HisH [Oscillospiraceae bacterium]
MIAIIDYGAGNIFSVKNALDFIGLENILTDKKSDIENADGIIFPGVGAFPSAMNMLKEKDLIKTIREQAYQKPFLGICLGMQLIFEKGFEFEETEGLSLIEGTVEKMEPKDLSIPHIGWNKLEILNPCPLMNGLSENEYVYFVHSYKAVCRDEYISAYCEYGEKVPALVFKGNIFGAQFHPEKSGKTGLKILKNFGEML